MRRVVILRICQVLIIVPALLCPGGCKKSALLNSPDNSALLKLKDVEGNEYTIKKIGSQVWMTENLRVGSFRDGTPLVSNLSNSDWPFAVYACSAYPHSMIDGLNSSVEVVKAYGVLYNWKAVTNSKGLCPKGWRIPTDEDWDELVAFAGGEDVAGGKLKSSRTGPLISHPRWEEPNNDATDNYFFSAVPAGYRSANGPFGDLGYSTTWWSSSEVNSSTAAARFIFNESTSMSRIYMRKQSGLSVRCIQE